MITQIFGEGVKGLSFKQQIGRMTLFCGPNGSGKSARCAALMLALTGCVPGVAKQNAEILDTFGNGAKLFVGVDLADKTHLLRRYSREDGSVSLVHMVDRKKATRDAYVQALAGIKVLDLSAFMALSDQKKIDTVFALFPPAGDIRDLDEKIDSLKTKQNQCSEKMRSLGATIERLLSAQSALHLPAGTMAEIDADIAEIEGELAKAREQLQAERIEIASAEAAAKATKDAEAEAARKAQELVDKPPANTPKPVVIDDLPFSSGTFQAAPGGLLEHALSIGSASPALAAAPVPKAELLPDFSTKEEAAESIITILDAIQRAGCGACAAALVCKRELRKFRKAGAA